MTAAMPVSSPECTPNSPGAEARPMAAAALIVGNALNRCGDRFCKGLPKPRRATGIPARGPDDVCQRLRQEADNPWLPSPSWLQT